MVHVISSSAKWWFTVGHTSAHGTWLTRPRPSFGLWCSGIGSVVLHVPLHLGSSMVHVISSSAKWWFTVGHTSAHGTWLTRPRPSFGPWCSGISSVVLHVPLHLSSS